MPVGELNVNLVVGAQLETVEHKLGYRLTTEQGGRSVLKQRRVDELGVQLSFKRGTLFGRFKIFQRPLKLQVPADVVAR